MKSKKDLVSLRDGVASLGDWCPTITYEGVSKIFRTGAANYTEVVVAQSTGRWWDYHV
jgi:hypothetical protein